MTLNDSLIVVDEHLELQAIDEHFVHDLHQLIIKNKAWLQHFLDWPQYVTSVEQSRQTAQSNMLLHQRGYAKMFVILKDNILVGVLSFNAIEPTNKTGYIGYWLDQDYQRQGIISASLQAVIAFYASRGDIRRFVIKCRVANAASNRVALRNGFILEGCLRQAEFLNGAFCDQNIYARIVTPASE
ncbi:50S ribosomal protein L7/L12-serine acetyltransferase [Yokenella regensburgei]|uniref:50S ribosomal protein L7/L12-serine acetyltransferase n=1 Tax=Yokenella regensburgei TaxID=158877 RepID=UPI003F150CEB